MGYQLARSRTTAAGDGDVQHGDATYVWYDFSGRHWRILVNDLRYSADYRAPSAFVRRTGIQANMINAGYELQPATSTWWIRVRPFVVARATRTVERMLDESFVDPGAELVLARNVRFYVYHSFRRDAFAGRQFDHRFTVLDYSVPAFKRLGVAGRLLIGEGVNFDPSAPQIGRAFDARLTVTWKPLQALDSEMHVLKSRLTSLTAGHELFDQTILRMRANYQLTRDHASRVVAEYNTISRRLGLSLLYGYTPRPNTAIYVGYGDQWLDGTLAEGEPITGRFHRLRRTFFLKVSSGWRR